MYIIPKGSNERIIFCDTLPLIIRSFIWRPPKETLGVVWLQFSSCPSFIQIFTSQQRSTLIDSEISSWQWTSFLKFFAESRLLKMSAQCAFFIHSYFPMNIHSSWYFPKLSRRESSFERQCACAPVSVIAPTLPPTANFKPLCAPGEPPDWSRL